MAIALFRRLEHRSVVDRGFVLAALRARRLGGESDRVVLCRNALTACLHDMGRASRGVYDQWRASRECPEEWPSSKVIRNTFGSWSAGLEEIGAAVRPDVLARRAVAVGGAFTEAEIVACIRQYAQTDGRLTFAAYRRWARVEMRNPARALPRLIRSVPRIIELFGSWRDAVVAAGFAERLAAERGGRAVSLGQAREYDETACLAALVESAAECGGAGMTTGAHDRYARKRCEDALAAGERVAFPRSEAISTLFGSWAAALHAAGLITGEELLVRGGHRTRFVSEEELVRALSRAIASRGLPLTCEVYKAWRAERRRAGEAPIPPTSDLIRKRLGGWPAALERACTALMAAEAGHGSESAEHKAAA